MTLPRRKPDAFKTGRCDRPIPKSLMSYDKKIPGCIIVLDCNGVEARKAAIDRQEQLEQHALAASDPNGGADATSPLPMPSLNEGTTTDGTTLTYLPGHNARAATVATARPSPSSELLRNTHALPATRDAPGRGASTPAQWRQDRGGSLQTTPGVISYARKQRLKRPKKTAQVVVEHKSSVEAPRDSYTVDASANIASAHTHPVSHRTTQTLDRALLSGARSSMSFLSPSAMPAVSTVPSPKHPPLKRRHDSDVDYPYENARLRHFVEPENAPSPHLAYKHYDLSAAEHMRWAHAGGVSSSAVNNSTIDHHPTLYFLNLPVLAEETRQYTQGPPLTGYEVFERPIGLAADSLVQTSILEQRDAERCGYDGQHSALPHAIPSVAFQDMVPHDDEPVFTLQTTSSQSPNFIMNDPTQFSAPSHPVELQFQHVEARVERDASYSPPHISPMDHRAYSDMMRRDNTLYRPSSASTTSSEFVEAIEPTYGLWRSEVVDIGLGRSFAGPGLAPAPIQLSVYQQDEIFPFAGRTPSPQQPEWTSAELETSHTPACIRPSNGNSHEVTFLQQEQPPVDDGGIFAPENVAELGLCHSLDVHSFYVPDASVSQSTASHAQVYNIPWGDNLGPESSSSHDSLGVHTHFLYDVAPGQTLAPGRDDLLSNSTPHLYQTRHSPGATVHDGSVMACAVEPQVEPPSAVGPFYEQAYDGPEGLDYYSLLQHDPPTAYEPQYAFPQGTSVHWPDVSHF